jgi:hypothetical protein
MASDSFGPDAFKSNGLAFFLIVYSRSYVLLRSVPLCRGGYVKPLQVFRIQLRSLSKPCGYEGGCTSAWRNANSGYL